MENFVFLYLITAGIISGTISALGIYFLFLKRRNSSFYRVLSQQIMLLKEDIKVEIGEIRDDIAPPGDVIQGIIEGMKVKRHSDAKLYLFYGLHEGLSDEGIFQDFKASAMNVNCIHYTWFDSFSRSEISAYVDNSESYPFLCIHFKHRSNMSSPNVAIRSQGDQALDNSSKRKYLSFEARISQGSTAKILLGIRVVNGWLQHWQYALRSNEYILIPVEDFDWKCFSVDLEDKFKWSLFDSDGNRFYGPESPDFRVITDVIIEVGLLLGTANSGMSGKPRQGEGSVDIREISLRREVRGTLL
jgi:hypothetical protein